MRTTSLHLIAVTALWLTTCSSGTTAATVPVETEVLARVLAPGEPARVMVRAAVPLRSATAEFLGQRIVLVRDDTPAGGERWSGWAIVALDQAPGAATIEVRAKTVDGRAAAGTHAVTIVSREFPTEELSVASRYVTPPQEVQRRLEGESARLAEIYKLRSAMDPPSEPFIRPVAGGPSSVFGTRRVFNGEPRSPHPGLDLRADSGTEVHVSGPGRVVLAQDLYYSGNTVFDRPRRRPVHDLRAPVGVATSRKGGRDRSRASVDCECPERPAASPDRTCTGAPRSADRPFDPEALTRSGSPVPLVTLG